MNILVFGAQGSGKGTHAKYIADKLGVPYIGAGDLFRELEKEKSPKGEKIRELIARGIIIPNELSVPAFRQYLKKFDVSDGVVLDGYPRNLDQARNLPIKLDLIVHITLPENVAIRRLMKRKRCDDTPGAIKQRLTLFRKSTKPVYDYFKGEGVKIVKIDNFPPVEEVQREIDELLKQPRNKNNG